MQKTCKNCHAHFTFTDSDQALLEKIAPNINGQTLTIPAPTLCPDCRQRRRLAHRNEQNLYQRTCDLTNKPIISIYSSDKPFKVYNQQDWWSDKWDAREYGRDFDFSRPFFEQFAELRLQVPRMNLMQSQNENSEYTNCVSNLKNCYLLFSSDYSQDCYYGTWNQECRDCCDNLMIEDCELAYDCVFSNKLFNCKFAIYSSNCSDSAFLYDCRGCRNCFMCYGLRNKEYHINNQPFSKEDYETQITKFQLNSHKNYQTAKKHFLERLENAIYPEIRKNGRLVNSTGDLLTDCENCHECYDLTEGKDCRFVQGGWRLKDALDCCYTNGELGYENCECFPMPYQSAFNTNCYTGASLYYCDFCMNNSSNCFGSIGLKHQKHCILNKQYTEEEYEALLPKIIDHMRQTGEWGEFFPLELSPFTYQESEANQYFPSPNPTPKTVPPISSAISASTLPDNTQQATPEICNIPILSSTSQTPFKIITQELDFHKKSNTPLPHETPQERHSHRLALKNPRHLNSRTCTNCHTPITTTSTKKNTYCLDCYQKNFI